MIAKHDEVEAMVGRLMKENEERFVDKPFYRICFILFQVGATLCKSILNKLNIYCSVRLSAFASLAAAAPVRWTLRFFAPSSPRAVTRSVASARRGRPRVKRMPSVRPAKLRAALFLCSRRLRRRKQVCDEPD